MDCPCHNKKPYTQCCEPIHNGTIAKIAIDLMRARYSAYALCLSDFIISTTDPLHPSYEKNTAKWRKNIEEFCSSTIFEGLEILDISQKPDFAYVIFFATLIQNGKDISFTEKSYFHKRNGLWLYLKGTPKQGRISFEQNS